VSPEERDLAWQTMSRVERWLFGRAVLNGLTLPGTKYTKAIPTDGVVSAVRGLVGIIWVVPASATSVVGAVVILMPGTVAAVTGNVLLAVAGLFVLLVFYRALGCSRARRRWRRAHPLAQA
jgi:hypothetical protein